MQADNDAPIIWVGQYDETVINYETASIPFMVYHPEDIDLDRASEVHLFKDGQELASSPIQVAYSDSNWANWDISAIYELGDNLFTIQCGTTAKNINVYVTAEGSRDLGLVYENTMILNMSSAGRSNSENSAYRSTWGDATLTNFNWYNNGWVSPTAGSSEYTYGSYLNIANGASVEIPMNSLSLNGAYDYSFEIRFRVRNVQKYSTLVTTIPCYFYIDLEGTEHNTKGDSLPLASIESAGYTVMRDEWGNMMMDEDNTINTTNTTDGVVCKWLNAAGQGFCIGTQEAFFQSPRQLVSVRYKEDEIINISFVVSKSEHLVYIYLNGILSGATDLPVDANNNPVPFVVNSNLAFNSDYCDFDLFRVRVYQYGLTMPNVIHNYLSDIHSISLYDQNQLTKASTPNLLSYELLTQYNEEHPNELTMPYAT